MDKQSMERQRYLDHLNDGKEIVMSSKNRLKLFFDKEAAKISFEELIEQCEFDKKYPKIAQLNTDRFTIRQKQPPQMINFAIDKIEKEQRFEKISQLERGRIMLQFLEKRRNPLRNQYFNQQLFQGKEIEEQKPKLLTLSTQATFSPLSRRLSTIKNEKFQLNTSKISQKEEKFSQKQDNLLNNSLSSIQSPVLIPRFLETQRFLNNKLQTPKRSRQSNSYQLQNFLTNTINSTEGSTYNDYSHRNCYCCKDSQHIRNKDNVSQSLDYSNISPSQLNDSTFKGKFILPLLPKNLEKSSKPEIKNMVQNLIETTTDHYNQVNSNAQVLINDLQYRSFQSQSISITPKKSNLVSKDKLQPLANNSISHTSSIPQIPQFQLDSEQTNSNQQFSISSNIKSKFFQQAFQNNNKNSSMASGNLSITREKTKKLSIMSLANEQNRELEETIKICDSLIEKNKEQRMNT